MTEKKKIISKWTIISNKNSFTETGDQSEDSKPLKVVYNSGYEITHVGMSDQKETIISKIPIESKFVVEILKGEGEIFIGIIEANKQGEVSFDTKNYVGEDG